MMIKRKLDGAVNESSVDKEIRKSNATVHNCEPIGTWPYGRLAGRLTKFGGGLKF